MLNYMYNYKSFENCINEYNNNNINVIFKGLSEGVSPLLLQLHGLNSIAVEIPSILSLLVEEVLHPFYIFQVKQPRCFT